MAVEFQAYSQALLSDNGDGTYTVSFVFNSGDTVNGEEFTELSGGENNLYEVGEILDQNNFNGPGGDVTVLGVINGGLVTQFGTSTPSIYFSELNSTAVAAGDIVTINPINFTPCFLRGSNVLTDKGAIAVEDLMAGDMVLTQDHTFKPVTWMGMRSIDPTEISGHARNAQLPVHISADALGHGRPLRDLSMSPEHCICHDGTHHVWQIVHAANSCQMRLPG